MCYKSKEKSKKVQILSTLFIIQKNFLFSPEFVTHL